ncbi:MAG: 2-succinyl-6-hydroxy-2,4-cyclohexadiene-1-carboxylate synthase [Myxococcota bacterium]
MPELRIGSERRLHWQSRGEGFPLLLLHGFTGSSEAWDEELVGTLARHFHVLCVDLPGHGRSDPSHDPRRYEIGGVVEELGLLLSTCGFRRALWLGYSMGGRIALAAGVLQPQRVSALVLESASPGLEHTSERAARIESDEALASRLERDGIEAFVSYWMELPLFHSQRRLSAQRRERERRQRLSNDPRALAACLRGLGTGRQPSFWNALVRLAVPVQLVVGEDDTKFRAIARRMAQRFPRAERTRIPSSGHAPHLESPEAWLESVVPFCERCIEKERSAQS